MRKKGIAESAFELCTRLVVYPYEYIDAFDKFDERHIPPKEECLAG